MRQCDINLQISVIIFRGFFSEGNPTQETNTMDITYLYFELSAAGAVVVVLGIVGLICLLKKKETTYISTEIVKYSLTAFFFTLLEDY